MALTIQQYYDLLAAEKATMPSLTALQPNLDDSQTLLADLTTPSQVARWRLNLWIAALITWVIATAFDIFLTEVDEKAAAAAPCTAPWLRKKFYEFQYGYDLEFVNDAPGYSVDDPVARIITQAAVTENVNGLVTCKVVKDNGSGGYDPLTSPELAAANYYTHHIMPPGTNLSVISLNADLLKLPAGIIYYNPLLSLPVIQAAVTAAINAYLKNLPFNGRVRIDKLIDSIQAVSGVLGVELPSFDAADAGGTYATYSFEYQTLAGHIIEDPLNTFITTLTWTVG